MNLRKFFVGLLVGQIALLAVFSMSDLATPPVASATTAKCTDTRNPLDIAQSKGWTPLQWLNYGGLKVQLQFGSELPMGWSAQGGEKNHSLTASQTWRGMESGIWSIYPPYACQAQVVKKPFTPPSSTPPAQQTSAPVCTDTRNPLDLANSLGWRPIQWESAPYNGLEVMLSYGSTLPDGWEANGGEAKRTIKTDDSWRGMESGQWTIYAPPACQAQVVQKPLSGSTESCGCTMPTATPIPTPSSTQPACDCTINPVDLALQMHWHPIMWEPDIRYNGLEVWLDYGSTLPAGWSADGGELNHHIGPDVTWRGMEGGKWTIYGPLPCQAGYERKSFPAYTPPSSVPQPTATTVAQQPAANCMLGKDLAAQKGWPLTDNQPTSVTDYGGAVVRKSPGGLPEGWNEICSTDGSTCSIYPPSGACRNQLGVKP